MGDEAISRGNRSDFGLAAAVWTRDIQKAHAVANGMTDADLKPLWEEIKEL